MPILFPGMLAIEPRFGYWTALNSGGNLDLPSYFRNPGFDLTIEEPSALFSCRLVVEEATSELFVNVSLFSSATDLIATTGNYSPRRAGVSLNRVSLFAAGTYRLILSTFLAGQ